MGALDGRVAIITGAGRGLGREHALLFASEGAKVVVNDLGGDMHGEGGDPTPAQQTVADIKAMGGEAVVNGENVADWDGAQAARATRRSTTFGDLHVLVNNAGILRDRVIINMTEAEWDAVIAGAPEGPLLPDPPRGRLLARADEGGQGGERVDRPHVVDVGPVLEPGPGQLRRGQVGIATLLAGLREGARALRRALERDRARRAHPAHRGDARSRRRGQGARTTGFDVWDPANVSPFVAYLATADCPFTGETFMVQGGVVQRVKSWSTAETHRQGRPLDGRASSRPRPRASRRRPNSSSDATASDLSDLSACWATLAPNLARR